MLNIEQIMEDYKILISKDAADQETWLQLNTFWIYCYNLHKQTDKTAFKMGFGT